ncbi:MAG: BspA family leucine-rich repeat surface protein [Gracilimonas sp.]
MNKLLYTITLLVSLLLVSCGSTDSTPQYTLTLGSSPSEGGEVSSAQQVYDEGTTAEIMATANEGWAFSEWTGDHSGTAPSATVTMDSDKDIMAVFTKKQYALTVEISGEGTVDEQVVQNKTTDYESGTVVELTANADDGWVFVEWQGDVTGSQNPQELTVDDPKNVTAVFEKKSYPLTITTQGEGAIDERIVQNKATDYKHGTTVELTANPATGWKFSKWQGDVTGSDNPIQLTVDESKDVTAVFEKKIFALTINTTGQGTVVKDPDQPTYEFGTVVELTANADNGWEFSEWQGDVNSTDTFIELIIDSPQELTAIFTEETGSLFYLAQNGVTIKCEDANVGDTGIVDGDTYTKRSAGQITTVNSNAEETCTSGITDMSEMFKDASFFDEDISGWDVSGVTDMSDMFNNADAFNQDIGSWDVSAVMDMSAMFRATVAFNGDISSWDVSEVTNMSDMFGFTDAFNQDIGSWDVSAVTDMSNMFFSADAFNGDISTWDVSSVTTMASMFRNVTVFNQDIGDWNVSSVKNMNRMFSGTDAFNQDIGSWDVSSVTDMGRVFENNTLFNKNIGSWDVSGVTNMRSMFYEADAFNQDIGSWDVSSVTDMYRMFYYADAFNQDIGGWDVSEVTDMSDMFNNADAFNGDIGGWNVSGVTDMERMFSGTDAFNQDIGNWDVSNVTDMDYMFYYAAAFNQDISGWCVSYFTYTPSDFATGSAQNLDNIPVWGTCP